jgi:glycosyltransferase involved in cell wall biosynthesis
MVDQKKKFIILIPVRNVDDMIVETLNQVKESYIQKNAKIILIDNKSTDNTIAAIENYLKNNASELDCTLIANEQNIGYGGSVKKGLKIAISQKYDWTIIIHGDNQTNWKLVLNQFNHLIQNKQHDIISTTRFSSSSNISDYSKLRVAGNIFFKFLTRMCTNLKISDPGVAIMAFKTRNISEINMSLLNEGYMFHPQLNILIFGANRHYTEIPMSWQDARKREPLNLFKYGINLAKFLIIYGFYYRIKKLEFKEALSKTIN